MIVFTVQPEVAAEAETIIELADILIPNVMPVVEPKSVVVVSVKFTALPDQIPINCPALAFEPLRAV